MAAPIAVREEQAASGSAGLGGGNYVSGLPSPVAIAPPPGFVAPPQTPYSGRLSSVEEGALSRAILADPTYQRWSSQQSLRELWGGSFPLQVQGVNDYLSNNPAGPLYAVNHRYAGDVSRGLGAYRWDIAAGKLVWVPIGVQHWWTDPGIIGPIAVAATTVIGAVALAGPAGAVGATAAAPASVSHAAPVASIAAGSVAAGAPVVSTVARAGITAADVVRAANTSASAAALFGGAVGRPVADPGLYGPLTTSQAGFGGGPSAVNSNSTLLWVAGAAVLGLVLAKKGR